MHYRELGPTGLRVSVIGVGTWQFGGEWGRSFSQYEVDAVLDQAAALGINLIDTAECYGDHLSERLIGDYLRRHERERWIVATKFGHHFHQFMDRTLDFSPEDVRRQLEASLRALRIERIDLYQFHSGSDQQFQNSELWALLAEEKKKQKLAHLGVSILGKGSELQARQAAEAGAEVLQVVYNRLDRRPEELYFPHVQKSPLGVLARVPLASGLLSGKYAPGTVFAPNDVRATFDAALMARNLAEVERIRAQELPPGQTMAAWALAWCLKNKLVSAVIPGSKTPDQVRANAAAVELLEG